MSDRLARIFWGASLLLLAAGLMFLQVWYHLLPQRHHNANCPMMYQYIINITTYNGTCQKDADHPCSRYGRCEKVQFPCLRYNRTWKYTVGSGIDLGGRLVTIPTRTYIIYDNTPDPAVVTQFATGPVRQIGYYDPHDPWNLWDDLDTTHRDWAIVTTFFLGLECSIIVIIGIVVCCCEPPDQPPRRTHRSTKQTRPSQPGIALPAIRVDVLVIPTPLPLAPGGPTEQTGVGPLAHAHILSAAAVARNTDFFS